MKPPGSIAVAAVLVLAGGAGVASAGDHDPTHGGDVDHAGGTSMARGRSEVSASPLQRLVDAASPGGVVHVPPSVFVGTIVIDRPVLLEGGGRTVIDGAGAGSVVTISAPDVTIRGFTIRGSGGGPIGSPSAVMIENADRARIEDVAIFDSYIGITVRSSADVVIDRVRITGRPGGAIAGEMHAVAGADTHDITGTASDGGAGQGSRGDGIWLWNATSPVVRDSTIEGVRDGVYISYGVGALVEDVTIERSRYAVHDMYGTDLVIRRSILRGNLSGCVVMYGGPIAIVGNTILENGSPSTGFGVLVKDAGDVTVARNVIASNRVGVHVDDAGRTGGRPTRVESNTLAMNQVGVTLYPSTDAAFVRNAFVENTTQVTLGGQGVTQAVWSEDGVGNYWSDYGGVDADGDGIGDLAHAESGRLGRVLAQDPLMIALASGPALRLLSSLDDRWSLGDPLVTDAAPLLEPPGPRLRLGGPRFGPPMSIVGAAMVTIATWSLVRARRPGRKGGWSDA